MQGRFAEYKQAAALQHSNYTVQYKHFKYFHVLSITQTLRLKIRQRHKEILENNDLTQTEPWSRRREAQEEQSQSKTRPRAQNQFHNWIIIMDSGWDHTKKQKKPK